MKFRTLLVFLLVFGFALAEPASAQMLPKVVVGVEQAKSPQEASIALQVIFLVTILSLAPGIMMMMTPAATGVATSWVAR